MESLKQQEIEFQEALKHWREFKDEKSWHTLFTKVYLACKAMAKKLLKVKLPDDVFHDRLQESVLTVIRYIVERDANPQKLINFCYWPVYSSFFGYRAIKEDKELSYDFMVEQGHWDIAV